MIRPLTVDEALDIFERLGCVLAEVGRARNEIAALRESFERHLREHASVPAPANDWPARERYSSVHDFEEDEPTLNGTRRFKVTETQLHEVIGTKVAIALRERAVAADAETMRALRKRGGAAVWAAVAAGAAAVGAGVWAWLRARL